MMFKIYNCDFGIKYNGQNYDFTHVDELQIEDPEVVKVTRGANAKNMEGLVYSEGLKEPKKWSVTIKNMSIELKAALDTCFKAKDRLDAYCIDRIDGSSKMLRQAVLSSAPKQLTLNDSPDAMNVVLMFEGFDDSEVHKS